MNPFGFCLAYIAPLSVVVGYYLGGIYFFLTPFITFIALPLSDLILGEDRHNPNSDEMDELKEQKIFRYILHVYAPIQVAIIIWGAYVVCYIPLSTLELIGFIFSVGIMSGGIGITAAHELCHRTSYYENLLGKMLLLTVNYMHFHIEHNRGHHNRIGTPTDPATARLGESLYRFYLRTLVYSYLSAWELETRRLHKRHLPSWSIRNQMLWFAILPLLFAAALGFLFGWQAVVYFFVQSIVAVLLLETVNYLEHYGLERRETKPGVYEKVSPLHSWNSNHIATNYFLFKLQRHSDHHAHPVRRYQTLRHFDESPQLPTGYAGMILLAVIPPIWRKIMDPRVKIARQRLANSSPV